MCYDRLSCGGVLLWMLIWEDFLGSDQVIGLVKRYRHVAHELTIFLAALFGEDGEDVVLERMEEEDEERTSPALRYFELPVAVFPVSI